MVGLILSAGKGTRVNSLCNGIPKPLLVINGRTLLEYNLYLFKNTSIKKVFIVVSPRYKNLIENSLKNLNFGLEIDFIVQKRQLGTAHAVKISQSKIGNENFLYLVGDNLTNFNLNKLIERHTETKADVTLALKEVEHPEKYGVAEINGKWVIRIVEKPENPPSNLSFTSMAIFEPIIFDFVKKVKKNIHKNEYFITDAIEKLVEKRGKVGFVKVDTWRLNINTPTDWEKAQDFAKSFDFIF